jgi:hypothetical protein
MDDLRAFQLEEYRSLRKEIEMYITESRTQERYAVIAVAAIWTWLIVNKQTSSALWILPVLATALIAFREFAIRRHFQDIKDYIKTLEGAFDVKGWEHTTRRWSLGSANTLLTSVLFVIALFAWFYRNSLVK